MSSRDNDTPSSPSNGSLDSLMDDERLLQQIRDALTPMPAVNQRAIANILSAVADRRVTRPERWRARIAFAIDQFRYATSPVARMTAVAAACTVLGFVARGVLLREGASGTPSAAIASSAEPSPRGPLSDTEATRAAPTLTQTVNDTADPAAALVSVQFVLDAHATDSATTVSVVGDFNEWNVAATPMTLERGAWSVSLPTTAGRHVYAFVLNGERWIADPRAPRAADADFGRPGSVIIVQAP